jgi:adenylate kinase
MGPQASGKGTQGKLLAEKFDIPRISTGDIFRKEIAEQTEIGKLVDEYLKSGKLVPDHITSSIAKKRLSKMDCKKGFILDGYPRNLDQALFLDSITNVDKVILVNISNCEAIKRISNRRVCIDCGSSYNLVSNPPKKKNICDKCGGKIVFRSDDYPDAIAKRLEIYRSQSRPMLRFYAKKNILIKVQGMQSIEGVYSDILKKLKIK